MTEVCNDCGDEFETDEISPCQMVINVHGDECEKLTCSEACGEYCCVCNKYICEDCQVYDRTHQKYYCKKCWNEIDD